MAFELAGARILSPVVGSSTYVWTSIIGVIIAALSGGYFLGGWLADKRAKQLDIMLLLCSSAIGILLTLLLSDVVLYSLAETNIDVRLQALLASLILFAPTSIILGALSPYLAKMHTASLEQTGRSIAALSAFNSLGGIAGTFSVGFIFFGFFGTRQTLALLIGLLVLSSLLLVSKNLFKVHLRLLIVVTVITSLALLVSSAGEGVIAQFETPSSSYQVRDVEFNKNDVRVLTMGPGGYQSGVILGNSNKLAFPYTQTIAKGIEHYGEPSSILILGGGGFILSEYFAQKYPTAQVDTVEIDPKLEGIAKQYFGYSSPSNSRLFFEDARTFMNKNTTKYDVIITDAYSDTGVPFSLTTTEFAKLVEQSLSSRGIAMLNVIAGEAPGCKPLLHSIYQSFSTYLEGKAVPVYDRPIFERQNIILAFTKHNSAWLSSFGKFSINSTVAISLTDNYAPIERLHQNCLNS